MCLKFLLSYTCGSITDVLVEVYMGVAKMGTAATRAKNKYNAANYEKIYLTVKPEIAERFRSACGENSQAVTFEWLLDEADAGKLDAAKVEYERLCGEWDKLEAKAKEIFDENRQLKAELATEKEKGLLRLVWERLWG